MAETDARTVTAAASRAVAISLTSGQLELALTDAQLVQHQQPSAGGSWRGYCTLNHRKSGDGERLREVTFPVAELPWFMSKVLKQFSGEDLYIAQHSYAQRQRRTGDLLSLNLAHVDLDIYKSAWSKAGQAEVVADLLRALEAEEVPLPSYVVSSGRGLQAKWLWTKPLAPQALPRWQAAHKWLVRSGGPLDQFGADDKAILPTQILRVVGSVHQGAQAEVKVLWVNGSLTAPQTYDFDEWCKQVLPYTREQVKEFKSRLAQYHAWDLQNAANLQQAAEVRGRAGAKSQQRVQAWNQVAAALGTTSTALANMDDLVAGEIWGRRLRFMERLCKLRSGVHVGERHEWIWVAANGLAWVNGGQVTPLRSDLQAWAKRWVPGYEPSEVRSAASAVVKRASSSGPGLYRMAEATFREKLKVTAGELEALSPVANAPERINAGAMGFDKMKGLSFDEYTSETRARQSLAAQRTNLMSRNARAPLVEKAKDMRARGASLQLIAADLGVSLATAHRWAKT